MKYLVQLKYTNPSHEHVSLRRRVDTVNRIVEAASEEEAINRSARQQRALGYLIQEAKVIDSDAKKESKEQLDEKEEVEQVDESYNWDKLVRKHLKDARSSNNTRKQRKHAESMASRALEASKIADPEKAYRHYMGLGVGNNVDEEVESVVEADPFSYGKAPRKGSVADLAAKKRKEQERNKQTIEPKDQMVGVAKVTKGKEEVVTEAEREAGYKMPAHVAAAQKKFDTQSKGQGKMRPQAGTLAAAKMKTEAMDPNEAKGEKKIVKTSKKAAKAAEKMVNAAKGRINKINIQPTMDIDVKSK